MHFYSYFSKKGKTFPSRRFFHMLCGNLEDSRAERHWVWENSSNGDDYYFIKESKTEFYLL